MTDMTRLNPADLAQLSSWPRPTRPTRVTVAARIALELIDDRRQMRRDQIETAHSVDAAANWRRLAHSHLPSHDPPGAGHRVAHVDRTGHWPSPSRPTPRQEDNARSAHSR